jgi:hypothetical protein
MKNKLSYLLIASSFVVSANASTFLIENFDGYAPFSDMNGQGGWVVSSGLGAGPAFDPVVIADSFTWDSSAGSATVGGIAPAPAGVTTMSYSALSLPLQSATAHPTTIRFEVAFTESTTINRNPFSVAVGSDAGNLLTVSFAPAAAGFYSVAWSSALGGSGSLGVLAAGLPTEFSMTTWDMAGTMKYSLSNSGTPIVTAGNLTGGATAATLINNFAVNWDSTTGGGVGDGSVTIDRIVVIPEPSSALLIGLSALGLIRRKR